MDTFTNGLQPAPAWNLQGPVVGWQASLIGLAVGYGAPWAINAIYRVVRHRDGLGMGDFKMLAWLGAFWGWQAMLGILFAGAFLGVFLGVPVAMASMAAELPRVRRTLRAFGDKEYASLDFAAQKLELLRLVMGPDGPQVEPETADIEEGEPLRLEIEAFHAACLGRSGEGVTWEEGQEAMGVADQVQKAVARSLAEIGRS